MYTIEQAHSSVLFLIASHLLEAFRPRMFQQRMFHTRLSIRHDERESIYYNAQPCREVQKTLRDRKENTGNKSSRWAIERAKQKGGRRKES
jgi:hypothetical protein